MSRAPNICFFNTTAFWGGGEKWHFEAAVKSCQHDYPTFFVCGKNSAIASKLEGTSVHPFYITVNNRSFLNPIKANQLVQFFKDHSIDIVIFNSPKDLKIGGVAAKKAGVKNIVYRRGIAVEVKPKAYTKKLFNQVVTHFIFNSEATKSLLIKHYPNIVSTKKTAIIYNALEIRKQEIAKNNSPLIIGNAGRLVEQKGQLIIPKIAKLLKDQGLRFKLKIAGDGPLYTELEQAILEEGVHEEVELMGFVADMNSFMSSIDVFISTATWEGFGFVLAEAMAHHVPVIGFDLSSNPELIQSGKNGFLVPPDNTKEFAHYISLLIEDENLRLKMGQEAFVFANTHFEAEKQFQKLMEFIQD